MWQEFSNGVYRAVARAAGAALGSFEFVESVFVRRSVTTGEVSLGRSDIDLTIVIRSPFAIREGASKILALCRLYRLLRTCVPIVGETFVFTPDELQRSYRLDPYRASIDRRSALLVYGKPVEIPEVPVGIEDAASRLVFWFRDYMPQALRQANVRNMRKFAIEMWNAWATAVGAIGEPYLTRRETEAAWRATDNDQFPNQENAPALFATCCGIAARVHEMLLPPLERLRHPVLLKGQRFNYLVVPEATNQLPAEARFPNTVVCTQEVLDLLIHYVSAFLWDDLPPEVEELDIRPPSYEEYVRSCRVGSDPYGLRGPGFLAGPEFAVRRALSLHRIRKAVEYLQRREAPPPRRNTRRGGRWDRAPSYSEYYREWYPVLYAESEQVRRALEALPQDGRPGP